MSKTTTTKTTAPADDLPAPEAMRRHAEALGAARLALRDLLGRLQADLDAVRRQHMPTIRVAARLHAEQHARLHALISAHHECFDKPRTQVVAGIKYGLQKQPGRLSWDDDESVCERIADLVDRGLLSAASGATLVVRRPRPVSAALAQLDARMLKRLGVTVGADTDAVLIKSVDSEVERAVNAMVREMSGDERAEGGLA